MKRVTIIVLALSSIALLLVVPLVAVFAQAFSGGFGEYWRAISQQPALDAIRLTIIVVLLAVPANIIFGVAAAWLLARFRFRGRNCLVAIVDLPSSVSPVVAGLLFVLLFGRHGWFGPLLERHGIQIIFALPGIVIATVFVTLPFVAREVMAVLEASGISEEEAALTLGASGWQTFWRVVLPKIKWGLVNGAMLAGARAAGEFGAVSIVSGHVRGKTNTIPLHVEILYNEYDFTAAFAVASLLTLVSVVTLILRKYLEWRMHLKQSSAQIRTEKWNVRITNTGFES